LNGIYRLLVRICTSICMHLGMQLLYPVSITSKKWKLCAYLYQLLILVQVRSYDAKGCSYLSFPKLVVAQPLQPNLLLMPSLDQMHLSLPWLVLHSLCSGFYLHPCLRSLPNAFTRHSYDWTDDAGSAWSTGSTDAFLPSGVSQKPSLSDNSLKQAPSSCFNWKVRRFNWKNEKQNANRDFTWAK